MKPNLSIRTQVQAEKRRYERAVKRLVDKGIIKGYEHKDYRGHSKRCNITTHCEYQTLWLNHTGLLKVKVTKSLPKVRTGKGSYRDVGYYDIDYYGWICIQIVKISTLVPLDKPRYYLLDHKLSPSLYNDYLVKCKNRP